MSVSDTSDFLEELGCAGVQVWLEGLQLRYRARNGALTRERLDALQARRTEILSFLRESVAPTELPDIPGVEAVWQPSDSQLYMARDPNTRNVSVTSGLRAAIDVDALRESLALLVQRHDVFRTRYLSEANGAFWVVTEREASIPLRVIDATNYSAIGHRHAVARIYAETVGASFDVTRAPLARVSVIRISETESVFIAAIHHSIFDRCSVRIFRSELIALYTAALSGRGNTLPVKSGSYREFASQQRSWLESGAVHQHLDYWRETLRGANTIFWLPVDRVTASENTHNLPVITDSVEGEIVRMIRNMARHEECTVFVVTLTAFCLMLSHWSGRGDTASWILDLGRARNELQSIIGCFIGSWPLRVDLGGDPTFTDAVHRVKRAYVEALPHTGISVRRLRPVLNRIRNGRYYPGVSFNFITGESSVSRQSRPPYLDGLDPGNLSGRLGKDSFLGLAISVLETDRKLKWTLKHSSYLFEDETVRRASICLQEILTAGVVTPDKRMSELLLPAITTAESRVRGPG